MTCIVAYEIEDGAFIGADTGIFFGDTPSTVIEGKIIRNGPLLFGISGDSSLVGLLEHKVVLHDKPDDVTVSRYLYEIGEGILEAAEEAGLCYKKDGRPFLESAAICLCGGKIYKFTSDFVFTPIGTGYWAGGSGMHIALGSLYSNLEATEDRSWVDKSVALEALEAATKFNVYVRAPYHVWFQSTEGSIIRVI